MPTVYGYIRVSSKGSDASPVIQGEQITAYCAKNDLGVPKLLAEPLGTSGVSTRFREREQGSKLLETIKEGDTVIAIRIDRLGRNLEDILNTLDRFRAAKAHVVVLNLLGQAIDLDTSMGRFIVQIYGSVAELEVSQMRERQDAGKAYWKKMGFAKGHLSWGMKFIEESVGGIRRRKRVWDMEQLKIVVELARRVGDREKLTDIEADFRARGLIDHLGRPWGQKKSRNENNQTRSLARFYDAVTWFHRASRDGILPPPYNEVSKVIKKRKQYRDIPSKRNRKPKIEVTDEQLAWTIDQWKRDYGLESESFKNAITNTGTE